MRLYNKNTNVRKIHKGDFMMEKDSDIFKFKGKNKNQFRAKKIK